MENKNLQFHVLRKPFYLDNDTLLVRTPSAKHMDTSHAEWFSSEGIPYLHTIRGYYMPSYDGSDEYIMLYSNDFEIPNIVCNIFIYLFDYFPNVKRIGVGCNKGKIGEFWTPKLKIYRENA